VVDARPRRGVAREPERRRRRLLPVGPRRHGPVRPEGQSLRGGDPPEGARPPRDLPDEACRRRPAVREPAREPLARRVVLPGAREGGRDRAADARRRGGPEKRAGGDERPPSRRRPPACPTGTGTTAPAVEPTSRRRRLYAERMQRDAQSESTGEPATPTNEGSGRPRRRSPLPPRQPPLPRKGANRRGPAPRPLPRLPAARTPVSRVPRGGSRCRRRSRPRRPTRSSPAAPQPVFQRGTRSVGEPALPAPPRANFRSSPIPAIPRRNSDSRPETAASDTLSVALPFSTA